MEWGLRRSQSCQLKRRPYCEKTENGVHESVGRFAIAKAAQDAHRLRAERSGDLEKYPPKGRLSQCLPQSLAGCVSDPYASDSRRDRKEALNQDIQLRSAGVQIRHHFENTLDRVIWS